MLCIYLHGGHVGDMTRKNLSLVWIQPTWVADVVCPSREVDCKPRIEIRNRINYNMKCRIMPELEVLPRVIPRARVLSDLMHIVVRF